MLKWSIFLILTGLLWGHLPHTINQGKCLGYFMPLYNRMTAQVLTFSEPCDLWWRSNSLSLTSKCQVWSGISSSHLISSHLGFVHPLQDVALHQCLPSSSVCCLPNPGGSLLLCYVILPSSAWSSSRPLPSPWLPLCASPCPPIVL